MTYHILNGDALGDRFPTSLEGTSIIMRECLVDGPIKANTLDDFFEIRAHYLEQTYNEEQPEKYAHFVLPELTKVMRIPKGARIYLWFEEDVFCQVNCWFLCFLLEKHVGVVEVYFVLPNTNLQWGFGGLDTHDLVNALDRAVSVSPLELIELAGLWKAYQSSDIIKMREFATELCSFEWIKTAVDAEIDRIVEHRPLHLLQSLIDQLGSDNFGVVFREFNKLAAIYGYGDLMVKRIFDEIVAHKN